MKTIPLPHTELHISRIAYGCMNLGGSWDTTGLREGEKKHAAQLIATALDQGINFFDHADIYTRGKSEAVFGDFLTNHPGIREKIILQTKCGIRFADDPLPGVPGRYDFSYEHILRSVDGSLRRLQTDYVDILLLHRPDPLMEPEEVAQAFDHLHQSGKVRYFGVSNHTGPQIAFLQKHLRHPLVANQVEINLIHAGLIVEGILANQGGVPYTAAMGTLDYCRQHNLLLQAWSPVAGGHLINPAPQLESRIHRTATLISKMAAEKKTTKEAIALSWLLRHPAPIQPIIGTTNKARLIDSCAADQITLSREEWYTLLIAAWGKPVP